MAGVTITVKANELDSIRDWLARIDPIDALPFVAAAGESVTRQRLAAGGPAPNGEAWPPWHPDYAAVEAGASMLYRSGALSDSIESGVEGDTAYWGSNLVYARIHQLGGTIVPRPDGTAHVLVFQLGGQTVFRSKVTIPARPYLGFGAEEERATIEALEMWWRDSLPSPASP